MVGNNPTCTGDLDSGISSDYTYTAAVNFHGTNQTINGVTFTGTTATTGTGWAITAGFTNSVGSSDSSVQGTMGAMLDQGFKFAGDPQKIKMTGLTDGQAYVFAFYNQAWGDIRNFDVSCSDLVGTIRVNQDQYDGETFDGLLVECTYIADGTEAEFTFDPVTSSTLHLYAFSNRVATSTTNTSLGTKSVGAFTSNLSSLTAGTRYEYAFVATNNGGSTQSGTSNFVTLGLPQVLTPGATDVTKTSVTLNTDLNSTGGVTYTTGAPFSSSTVSGLLMWLDGDDPDADGTPNTTQYDLADNTGWKDKSGNYRDANRVTSAPTFLPNTLNGRGVIDLGGGANGDAVYMDDSADNLAAHTEKFSIFMLYRMTGVGYGSVHVQTVTSSHTDGWRFGAWNDQAGNVARFNSNLYPSSDSTGTHDTDWHLIQATLDDQDSGNVWLDETKVLTNGQGADNGTNRKPQLLLFGLKQVAYSYRAKVQFADFFIINRVVSESERLKIEGHLARKWDLFNTVSMFSASHPYYSTDPYQPTVTQGGENATVTFYWGDNNGSTTPGNWDNTQAIAGTHDKGVVSHALTGLTTGTTYYYTAKAVTSAGTSWGPVQSFVPANTALNKYSIPDLGLWLDATDLNGDGTTDSVTSGTAVASWADKSLGGQSVTQSTADQKPTRQANSFGAKAAVRFDGVNDLLSVSTIRGESGGYAVYAAVRRPDQVGDPSGHLVSESGWSLVPSGSDAAFPAIISKKSGTSGSLTNIKLGKSASTTTNDFGGDLGELLIFTRQLSTSEEQKVEGYLAHRWGATASLNANHPYKSVAPIFDNKPLIRDLTSQAGPDTISGISLWFDASDLDADGLTDSAVSGDITTWKDKSGNGYNASTTAGSPALSTNGGPGGGRVVQFRSGTANSTAGDEEMSISGSFTVRDHFYVVRSPSATWSDYGGIIGGGGSRHSNFIVERNQVYFHLNQYPSKVWKNGTSISSGNFSLSTINSYMILRIVVNGNNLGPHSNWKIGDDGTGWSMDMDLAEAICFSSELSNADAAFVEGYLAVKWGLTSTLPSVHNYKSYTSWPDVFITTGQPVNLQILADRNPTSWSASGLSSAVWILTIQG